MDSEITFGAWLKSRRRQLDITQKELAYQAGCSVGTIRKIESDERRPSRQLATLLAEHLDIPLEQIEPFIAFARAEAYTAEVTFPAPSLDDEPAIGVPDILHRPTPFTIAHNLPAETTSFIGREAELAALAALLRSQEHRLVTIVGSGGIGKTRLALACATQQIEGIAQASQTLYPNGVFFVDLVPLGDADSLIMALVETLGFSLQDGALEKRHPKQQLLDYLKDRRLMLLLDNFEHLLDPFQLPNTGGAASLVAQILESGREVQILVTSRERLNLPMEQFFLIKGLSFPDEETAGADEQVEDMAGYTARYTSMQLFLQSAQRNKPNFALENSAELAALINICRLVEGMPLAIELAGSWVDVLSVMDIATELQQGQDILETEQRYLPNRQRSMLATFEYSWRRLGEKEQTIFAQLSIFRGGFSRPAAMTVTGATLRQLSRLVNKSFIQFSKRRDRYQVHELLRQFGADQLSQDRELERVSRLSHSTYYCQVLGALTEDLKGAGQKQAISAIAADIDNVRLAWNHAVTHHDLRAIDISLEALRRFYWIFGWHIQGVNEFENAIAALRIGDATVERRIILGRLLGGLSRFYGWIGQPEKTIEVAGESLDLLRQLGAREEALTPLLFLADFQEPLEESSRLAREGLALAREFDDRWAIGHALMILAFNAHTVGAYKQAEQLMRKALKQFRQNSDVGGTAWATYWLSILVGERGRYEEALILARETMSIARELIFPIMGPRALGISLYALGEYEEAEEQFQHGLKLLREKGLRLWACIELFYLGKVAFKLGDYKRAAQRYHESLAGSAVFDGLELTALNHDALGRLHMAQGACLQAREHFLAALQATESPTTLLVSMASIAELFAEEGELDYAAILAMIITDQPASQARIKERAARLLNRLEGELPTDELANIRQRSWQSDLDTVAAQLLEDLKSS